MDTDELENFKKVQSNLNDLIDYRCRKVQEHCGPLGDVTKLRDELLVIDEQIRDLNVPFNYALVNVYKSKPINLLEYKCGS